MANKYKRTIILASALVFGLFWARNGWSELMFSPTAPANVNLTTTISPTGAGSIVPNQGSYKKGDNVILTAQALEGWQFDHWTGTANDTVNPTSVTMTSDKQVVAFFVRAEPAPQKSEKSTEPKIIVAVYPIKISGADKALEPVLTSLLISKLSQSNRLTIIEEAMMGEVLKRLNFANSDLCDNSQCQLQVGKMTPAKELIVPTVSKLGDKFIFDARVIDIEKADIDFSSETKKICKEDELDELIADASIDIRVKFGEKGLQPGMAAQASPVFSAASSAPEEPLESKNILGIVVVDDPSAVNNYHTSVRVKSVLPDSPCKGIIEPDDVITNLNPTGHVVLGSKALNYIVQNMDDFKKLVSTVKPGDSVMIWLFSKGAMTSHHPVCTIPASQTEAPPPVNKKVTNPAFTKGGKP